MSQDISLIRKELENHIEVALPYEFPQKCHIKYITFNKKKNSELFYKGGDYISYGCNSIRVKNKVREWNIPINLYHKDGSVKYKTHFYILNKKEKSCEGKNNESNDIINFQQSTIDKLTISLGKLEVECSNLKENKKEYEELLQKNRHHLKELSMKNREMENKLNQYEEVIKRLTNSHPLFNSS